MISGRLENGLRYAVRQSGSSVAYCAISIDCGTRAESLSKRGKPYHEGLAHFAEHTIFKGSSIHNADYINSCLDRLGGELNAYTTKEEIVFHATVLKDDLMKAAGLLFELASCPTFPEAEIEMEKGVVCDEIAACKDSPSEEIYDRFEEFFYAGHPLGRSILGSPRSVHAITRDELLQWVEEYFIPERMAFTIVSPLSEKEMETAVRKLSDKWLGSGKKCSSSENGEECRPKPTPDSQIQACENAAFNKTISRKGHQVNCIIAAAAPSLYSGKKRIAAVLLGNILGGPAGNSILNSKLREKNGLVYNVECSYTQYKDNGIMAICFGCDKENLEKCINIIHREILRLQHSVLGEIRFKAARKQLLGQMAISGESGEAQCLSMGKSLLAFGKVMSDADTKKAVEAITAEELKVAAEEIFKNDAISRLIYI